MKKLHGISRGARSKPITKRRNKNDSGTTESTGGRRERLRDETNCQPAIALGRDVRAKPGRREGRRRQR